jgi:hypothetical protein
VPRHPYTRALLDAHIDLDEPLLPVAWKERTR